MTYNAPKTSACVKRFDGQTKWRYFLIENDNLFEKYNTIWDKISADIKKKFDSEPAYYKYFLIFFLIFYIFLNMLW